MLLLLVQLVVCTCGECLEGVQLFVSVMMLVCVPGETPAGGSCGYWIEGLIVLDSSSGPCGLAIGR